MHSSTLMLLCSCIIFCEIQADGFNAWQKNGQCPETVRFQHCHQICLFDIHCQGLEKCCTNNCGGTMCTKPAAPRIPTPKPEQHQEVAKVEGKEGVCPNPPTGPWVCSSRCNVDSHCRGVKKCCRNRCGAMACVDPELEQRPQYEYYDGELDY